MRGQRLWVHQPCSEFNLGSKNTRIGRPLTFHGVRKLIKECEFSPWSLWDKEWVDWKEGEVSEVLIREANGSGFRWWCPGETGPTPLPLSTLSPTQCYSNRRQPASAVTTCCGLFSPTAPLPGALLCRTFSRPARSKHHIDLVWIHMPYLPMGCDLTAPQHPDHQSSFLAPHAARTGSRKRRVGQQAPTASNALNATQLAAPTSHHDYQELPLLSSGPA